MTSFLRDHGIKIVLVGADGSRWKLVPLFIGPDDTVYCVDDWSHAVHKFTPDGKLLMTIETADHPADTGYVWDHPETGLRSGPSFCYPTGLALSPEGDIHVTHG